MRAEDFSIPMLLKMRHSPVRNYVVPGLTSWMIGQPGPNGCVRMFECSRDHQEVITPHSHRFDFQCWVLMGEVKNRVWMQDFHTTTGDWYMRSKQVADGDFGQYRYEDVGPSRWLFSDDEYSSGQCYSMKAHEVHSIYFSRGALVLFFEGPTVADDSIVLQPYVDGVTVPTMQVSPWMFQRDVPVIDLEGNADA